MWSCIAWIFLDSCPSLPSAGIIGMYHSTRVMLEQVVVVVYVFAYVHMCLWVRMHMCALCVTARI